jgi:hypothetical protein
VSDFLINLARRSAGLAPVVRPRSAPAAESPSETAEGEAARPHEIAAAPAMIAAPTQPVVTPIAVAPVQPVIAPIATAPALVVQRAPIAMPVGSPAPPSPLGIPAAGASSVIPTHTAATIEPARAEQTSAPAPPLADSPLLGAIEPHSETRIEIHTPAIAPPHGDRSQTAASPVPRPSREREVVREETRVVERRIDSMTSIVTEPAAVMIEPAPLAAAAPAAPRTEPMPERTVHVRIGAIEIHAAQPTAAPLPPSTPAAVIPQTPAAGGFDDFARLRSYAPWEW